MAAWVNELQEKHGAPVVKQQLAAVRMLFDWLISGQVGDVPNFTRLAFVRDVRTVFRRTHNCSLDSVANALF